MGGIKPGGRRLRAGDSNRWREFELIEWLRRRVTLRPATAEMGIGDDAAVARPAANALELTTCDALVENVHWSFAWCDASSLGKKAVAVNLSDIAAMGGIPQRAFMTLAIPKHFKKKDLLRLTRAVIDSLEKHHVLLAGGDTVLSSGPMFLALTIQGKVPPKEVIGRGGARPGDVLLVTGTLGAAAAALACIKRFGFIPRELSGLKRKLLTPEPRLHAGRLLARAGGVHAMIDLSDGLAGDARRLAQASQVGVYIDTTSLPVSAATRLCARRLNVKGWELALRGGEDYELLFAAPAKKATGLVKLLRQRAGVPCCVVGKVVSAREGLRQILPGGRSAALSDSWEHGG
ncbi:thiamine-phosphate kinase [candidate division FCPU426 bacterium]|nr:thiamine-phosphate kinase [candidate division FCPU426 bacterium]